MFSFLSKETPALQLYGKLPLAKDYLRIGCGDGAGRGLREWMDRGFSSALEGSAAPSLPGPLGFLWADGSATALLGVLWPSSDAGGLRPFPFVLFVERKWRALQEDLEAGLAESGRWLAALEGCRRASVEFADGAALLSGLRGKKVAPEPAPASGAGSVVGYEAWIEALWPGQGQSRVEAQLGEILRLAGDPHPGPLRLPLTQDRPHEPQIHAWWSVLVTAGLIPRKGGMALFFPRADSMSWLTVFPREPEASQVEWLTRSPLEGLSLPPAPGNSIPGAALDSGPTLAKSLCGTLALVRARTAVP